MLPSIVSGFGSNGMLLATPLSTTISFPPYLNDKNANLIVEVFRGECTEKEIQRLVDLGKHAAVGCVIGLGGVKTLDSPRQLSAHLAVPIVICATAASTDAPTSARAVIYNDRGEVLRYLDLPRNPDVVLLDTAIIVQAPVRLLVSGMGDALSTYFEAESCRVKEPLSLRPAFEHVVEANSLLSGVGFESAGLGCAHAVHNGLSELPECHKYYPGEKVAIGVLTGIFFSDASQKLMDEVYGFCESVGLPTTLADIGILDLTNEKLDIIANRIAAPKESIYNEFKPVSAAAVKATLLAADMEGRRRKACAPAHKETDAWS